MNKEKSMKVWLINRESRRNKREVAKWAQRKEFAKACKDVNCFGKITEGAHPEKMNESEYEQFISQFVERKMVI